MKYTIAILLVTGILIQAASASVVSVEPSSVRVLQGQNFTVNITVDPDGNETNGAQYWLYFDNILLNATEQKKGPFLSQDGANTSVYSNEINNTIGQIMYGETRMGVDYGVTSPGVLANITFRALEPGICTLNLSKVRLTDPVAQPIPNVSLNGSVEIYSPNHVVISEVYVDAVNETSSEWIELYNPTNSTVNISNWTINTASYQPDAKLPLGAAVSSYSFYLIGDTGWNPDNSSWHTPDYSEDITLKNNDGWVQLNDSTGAVIDTLGWGSATTNETLSFKNNPPQNQSLQRKISDTIIENGYGPAWDTNNNSADFFIQSNPNPQNSGSGPLPPIPELNTLILFATGIIALAGYVSVKNRRDK